MSGRVKSKDIIKSQCKEKKFKIKQQFERENIGEIRYFPVFLLS